MNILWLPPVCIDNQVRGHPIKQKYMYNDLARPGGLDSHQLGEFHK